MISGRIDFLRYLLLCLLSCCLAGIPLAAQDSGAPDGQQDPLQRPRNATKPRVVKTEKADQQWLDQDVVYIILPEERDAFKKLTNDAERQTFKELFWERRNPHPQSAENESKEEHYRRIAFANERFAAGTPGWKTDRGRIYIIHGAPDSIESHPSGGPYLRTAEEGGGETITHPFEIWHYHYVDGIGQDINVEFVDKCDCGAYQLTLDRSDKDMLLHGPNAGPTDLEALGLSPKSARFHGGIENLGPTLFGNNQGKEFDRLQESVLMNAPPPVEHAADRMSVHSRIRYNLLPFDVRVDFVKGDNSTVLTPVTIQVPNRNLSYVLKEGAQHAVLNLSGSVTNLTGRVVSTFDAPLRLDIPADLLERFAANASLYQEVLWLHPGHYRLDVMLKDMNGDKVGIFAHSIEVPDFTDRDKLVSSTLILADLMDPAPPREVGSGSFVLGASKVRPRVAPANGNPATFAAGQRVNLWMQVYHFSLDEKTQKPSARIEYNVVNLATGAPVFELVQTTAELDIAGDQITLRQRLPPENLKPGVYQVTIRINDLVAQESIATGTKFEVK